MAKYANNLESELGTLDTLIRYAPDLIYWKDKNSIHLGCNDQFAKAAGFQNRHELIGKSDHDLPWKNRANKYIADDEEVILKGVPKLNIEDIVTVSGGKEIHVISNKVPLRDSKGNIIGILGIATDITAQKKMEYELRHSRSMLEELQMLNNIIKYAPDMIYWKDKNSIHMGCNDQFAIAAGFENRDDVIGKSDQDFPWHAQAAKYNTDDREVIASGEPRLNIEDVMPFNNGKNAIVITNKVPLRNPEGTVIGVLGIATDITHQKKTEQALKKAKESAETALQSLQKAQAEERKQKEEAERLAIENAAHKAELETQAEFIQTISKLAHDVDGSLSAIQKMTSYLVNLKEITAVYGYDMDWLSSPERHPNTIYIQYDDKGLRYEVIDPNDALQKGLIPWEQFATQLKKDYPKDESTIILFQKECLNLLLEITENLKHTKKTNTETRVPENYRVQLVSTTQKVSAMMHGLLNRYRNKDVNEDSLDEPMQVFMPSTTLQEVINERRIQHDQAHIEFIEECGVNSHLAFIEGQRYQINRAIANLMNNAVQSFEGKPGKVTLKLEADEHYVYITVQDSGKGMPPEMIDKVMNDIAFTHGKKEGHGLGLKQVRDTLKRHIAEMQIQSEIGKGTQFTLKFNKHRPPNWSLQSLSVNNDDIIVILDDDDSIHGVWNLTFDPLQKKYPTLRVEHFYEGKDALDFICALNEEEKKQLLLLTDYELLHQENTGIDIIEQSKVSRAILVTSHYNERAIQNAVLNLNAKLLPKRIAMYIPVNVLAPEIDHSEQALKSVDAVWLDDDASFTDVYEQDFMDSNKKVDMYRHPQALLDTVQIYAKNTPIFLDNNFEGCAMHGTDVASKLHHLGFTRLFLISGDSISHQDCPYLTVLRKLDLDNLMDYF